jgi:cytoskeleton protein RodZ
VAIGERLREARMRQKIDIADVETATKIRAKYLRALENEEFGLLPGNTFVKTFLRTYAEYLGLDPQLLLEEYRAEYEPRAEGEMQPYAVAARQRPRERRRQQRPPPGPPGPGTALIVIVGVVLVIFAILGLTSGGNDNEPSSSPTTPKQTERQKQRQKKKKAAARKVTSVKLRVAPASATYVCIDRGPGTPVVDQRTLSQPARYSGKRLRVNLGNSSVRVTANGKRVKIPTGPDAVGYDFRVRSGKVAWDTIPLGQRPCA